MKIWIDAHLSPGIAAWINENFEYEAKSLRSLGLRDESDPIIFQRAKAEGVVFITKDTDFIDLVDRYGVPPYVILLRCGNTTNKRVREILSLHLPHAIELFDEGESVVEIFESEQVGGAHLKR
jgi:predicted nuclease of predicted toxin-antitoxin system